MRFLSRKSKQLTPASERLAARIAARIISWQLSVAVKINRWINSYSKLGQRKMLWLFCIAWVAVLCLNLFRSQNMTTIHAVQKNYLPAHIGQSSDIPRPGKTLISKTDSITIKK